MVTCAAVVEGNWGGYTLQRIRRGEKSRWLLIKRGDDDGADARRDPASAQPESVKTGRTLKQVAEQQRG